VGAPGPIPDARPVRDARPVGTAGGLGTARPGTIVQRGRAKAYRPLPASRRREILAEGLAAYERGDFFLAHELLEPAWMGASDPAERDLYQGLIKLAAAFVHAVRGNPAGVGKNLAGAREHLADANEAGRAEGLAIDQLIDAVDAALSPDAIIPIAIPIPRLTARDIPARSTPGDG
jgi:predicted metal-dependent hydrolase